ncbi:MAG: membrane protein insertase YidC [Bacteriovoracaceae bacterium]|jgi:YidC/Oxa1 family membrane protein insertase|nr:membrane protein insertase YidC [Bacteriovoracaceae bacterium]
MGSDQKRALLAVVLSGVILFGWQYFFAPKNPVVDTPQNNEIKQVHVTNTDSSDAKTVKDTGDKSLKTLELVSDKAKYTINSNLEVVDANFYNTKLSLSENFEQHNNGITFFHNNVFQKLFFAIQKTSENRIDFTNSDLDINGFALIDEKGMLNFSVSSPKAFKYGFSLKQKEQELTAGKTQEFILLSEDLETFTVGSDDEGDQTTKWFGMDYNYHLFTYVIPQTPLIYKIYENGSMNLRSNKPVNQLTYKSLFIKKEYDILEKMGDNLHLAVNFGFFSILATPILKGLQYFYELFPNYGIAIILLTILMRLLTFPLQYKSYKSMKKMQVIQPELAKIKEKYKENPQRMQQETMALFKKAGANPLGGCLPMLLQMPIFFAFYRVLYNAVELVEAPFYFWITDLSLKDPYYVLPVLMAVSMFFHQKLTPTASMDPTQKKIMMFMPLIFAVFMKDFPAGLTLYIFVSTVFGMLQQLFVYRKTA